MRYLRPLPRGPAAARAEPCPVPLAPEALAQLYARYLDLTTSGRLPDSTVFEDFYYNWRSARRGTKRIGLDDGAVRVSARAPRQLITRPAARLRGAIHTLVLLVDFPDLPHNPNRRPGHFRELLFSTASLPTGSMPDFYRKVSGFGPFSDTGIDVQGEVRGWFRMPQPLSFYADGNSGLTEDGFPRDAQGLARDAVRLALAEGVDFTPFDALGEHTVTAQFIVHAGRGAEKTLGGDDLWSLKWGAPEAIEVAPGLTVATFLTVPENCAMGVCAHEWGHLAAGWADFSKDLVLRPSAEHGDLVFIQNADSMTETQYILVEFRRTPPWAERVPPRLRHRGLCRRRSHRGRQRRERPRHRTAAGRRQTRPRGDLRPGQPGRRERPVSLPGQLHPRRDDEPSAQPAGRTVVRSHHRARGEAGRRRDGDRRTDGVTYRAPAHPAPCRDR